MQCVRVHFEIGHEASIRNKRTVEGFTHDWEVFVRGVDNAAIHNFIEKVVFHLHDTFPKPKRTIKDPPFCVKESGYAGFNLPIDIYFKTKDEHRKVRFFYDLTLQTSGPRISNVVREKSDFTNPSEDFRRKLIKGGGIGIGSDGSTLTAEKNSNSNSSINSDEKKPSPLPLKPKISSSSEPTKKHKGKDIPRTEDTKGDSSFQNLFGTPIKPVKHSPTSSKSSTNKLAQRENKTSHEKQAKEVSKSKHSPHKERDRDKDGSNVRKEKDSDRSSSKEKDRNKEKDGHREKDKNKEKPLKKPVSPLPPPPPPPPPPVPVKLKEESSKKVQDDGKEKPILKTENVKVEKKHKEKKNREDKEKKERHKDHHEKKEAEKEKNHEKVEKKIEPKEVKEPFKPKLSSNKEEKKVKTEKEKERGTEFDKQRHKHKKKDKHKDEEKERLKKKEVEKPPDVVKVKPKSPSPVPIPPPPPPQPQPTPKATIHPLNMLLEELPEKDSDSDYSLNNEDEPKFIPPSEPLPPPKPKVEEKKVEMREEKIKKKERKVKEEDRESRKRKKKAKEKDEPPEKTIKLESKEEKGEKSPIIKHESRSPTPENQFTDAYVTQLKDLQHKIMTLQDNADLQRVVQVISETGQFEITQRTFDFDLCALDRSTVKRLQDMFIAAS